MRKKRQQIKRWKKNIKKKYFGTNVSNWWPDSRLGCDLWPNLVISSESEPILF
jgi:hypothetical protein